MLISHKSNHSDMLSEISKFHWVESNRFFLTLFNEFPFIFHSSVDGSLLHQCESFSCPQFSGAENWFRCCCSVANSILSVMLRQVNFIGFWASDGWISNGKNKLFTKKIFSCFQFQGKKSCFCFLRWVGVVEVECKVNIYCIDPRKKDFNLLSMLRCSIYRWN